MIDEKQDKLLALNIGNRIKNLRFDKNMTIKELSKRSGLSQSLISHVEQGKTKCSIITLYKITHVLGEKLSHVLMDIERGLQE